MNETVNTILSRRSVRKYKDTQISDEQLEIILKCAKSAPSGMNIQPWHFTVVQDRKLINDVSRECFGIKHKRKDPYFKGLYWDVFYDAPTVIFVSRDKREDMSYFDCCLAAENIVIAAKSLGLDSCIIIESLAAFEGNKRDDLLRKLEVPTYYEPHVTIAIGYKDEKSKIRKIKENDIAVVK